MNEQPTVCAVMLTRDRPELARRAFECFRAQTYPAKELLIWDTGEFDAEWVDCDDVAHVLPVEARGCTIGDLRNDANEFWNEHPIIVHWDDDDWSHPNRITEQVALLRSSGADVVGYNEMLFWRDRRTEALKLRTPSGGWTKESLEYLGLTWPPQQGWLDRLGEAWLYSYGIPKPTLGTSLMYWRKTWEQRPFNPKLPNNSESTGEDWDFIQGRKVAAVSAFIASDCDPARGKDWLVHAPRMIARIHGANSTKYNLDESRGDTWKRVPQWDERVRDILK